MLLLPAFLYMRIFSTYFFKTIRYEKLYSEEMIKKTKKKRKNICDTIVR